MITKYLIRTFSITTSFKLFLFSTLLIVFYFTSNTQNNGRLGAVMYSDAEGYYMYLPAFIIYHGFENLPVITKDQFHKYPGTKKIFTKYTFGVALLEAPFFLIAHLYESITNPIAANGYSEIYIRWLMLAASFYALLGLAILYSALRKEFPSNISVATPIIILLGTNLYYYTFCQPGMSHVYSFFLFALVARFTPSVLKSGSFKKWSAYGFLFGLIVLIRPTNVLLMLYPILYGCYSLSAFTERVLLFKNRMPQITLSTLAACIAFIPQFLYWKYISGNFIMDSYASEPFSNWNHPQIANVLFSVQNGWIIYTPMAVLALLGLFFGINKKHPQALVVLIILSAATYAFASWWCWWFGGAFGHRCYVEYYPLLAFGLATFISMASSNKYLATTSWIVIIILIYYNIRLTDIYYHPLHSWQGAEWTWETFYNEGLSKIF